MLPWVGYRHRGVLCLSLGFFWGISLLVWGQECLGRAQSDLRGGCLSLVGFMINYGAFLQIRMVFATFIMLFLKFNFVL